MKDKFEIIRKCIKHLNIKNIQEVLDYIKSHGINGLKNYVKNRITSSGIPYESWFEEHIVTNEELKIQENKKFSWEPLISIIVPVYKTPIEYLQRMIESVLEQSYMNWELCIADGSEEDGSVANKIKEYQLKDCRIKYQVLDKNKGISGNTNKALELAMGDYIGLLDHDDMLAPNALFEIVKNLQEQVYDILYTDEDMINKGVHCNPIFKPDFSIDLFRSHNYISHFFVVKKTIVDEIGGFRKEYDGSQDYDFMFRCIEKAKSIKHISKILYHWRMHEQSVAGNPESKLYAYDAGKRAIEDHLKRMKIAAQVEMMDLWGMYHVKYETEGNPLLSIVIPNKDHVDDLDKCIRSISERSVYPNYEFVIVENNSEDENTFNYYQKIEKKYENLKVVKWDNEFNYAAINNFGVQYAEGDYILFLNNDTELISPTALQEMLGCCMREEVGIVGAKLLYADDTVQHAGVVIGFGNYAGHVNTNIKRDDCGYMNRALINCNYSAVTGACMMIKKNIFMQVDGFDERFKVACNDVDLCLKVRALDKLIVYNAFSEWYHYESKSRGYEDTKEKKERFEGEVKLFQAKWSDILKNGDPFYNRNFSLIMAPFKLGH